LKIFPLKAEKRFSSRQIFANFAEFGYSNPLMRINLQEIPDDGKHFICNRNTGELNEILKDLIGNTPHSAEFTIRPLSTANFELRGYIKTEMLEQCSRCGIDFNFKVNESFQELLIPGLKDPRNAHYSKANHISDLKDDNPSVAEYEGHWFEMGEYLHEVIALTEPLNPAPPVDEKDDCSLCKISVKNQSFSYIEEMEKPESPFAQLKGLKLN
jgi:uncharacterized protein